MSNEKDYEKKRDDEESKYFSRQMRSSRKIEDTIYCKTDFNNGFDAGFKLGQESASVATRKLSLEIEMLREQRNDYIKDEYEPYSHAMQVIKEDDKIITDAVERVQ